MDTDWRKYLKFYRGEEKCPEDWCGEPQGVIWGAEKQIALDWDYLVKQEQNRPLEERIEEWVSLAVGKFDPWDAVKDMEFYRSTKGRDD